jgi:predicted membrane channel-forming protein YqfA (hemolysin III family)
MADEPPERPRVPLPAGYRPGIITAITVLLGFSLLFFRYFDCELPGEWTPASTVAAILMGLSILMQFVSLWRSLQVKDDDEAEYAITLRWFLSSAIVLLASLALAGLSISHIFNF